MSSFIYDNHDANATHFNNERCSSKNGGCDLQGRPVDNDVEF